MYWNVCSQFGGQPLWRELLAVLRTVADRHDVSVANVALRCVVCVCVWGDIKAAAG